MTSERAREIVSKFKDQNVLVVGDLVLDQYAHGRVTRLNPEAPVPILEVVSEDEQTGGAGNAAKNIVTLGGRATLVSVVGIDDTAEAARAAAGREGYEVLLVGDASRPTIRKVRYLADGHQMLRVDYEDGSDVAGEVEGKIIDNIKAAAEKADAILVSDYAKGVITEKVAKAILEVAKRREILVSADVKPAAASYFAGVTCIAPNRKEAHEMLGLNQHEKGGRPDKELAASLKEMMKCDVFLTLSEKGMYVAPLAGEDFEMPGHPVEIADTSGAGDTATAAMLLARLSGASLAEEAEIGNAAGAVVVGHVGAVGVKQTEMLSMLDQ